MMRLRSILFLIIFSNLILCCNEQGKKSNKFSFKYLKKESTILKDSTKLKMSLYFDDMSLDLMNYYISDISRYRKTQNDLNLLLNVYSKFPGKNKKISYIPNRLKSIKIIDEKGYTKYILDSLFYQSLEVEQLAFIAEKYYDYAKNIRSTREGYEKDINTAIEFKYDYKQPISFYRNSVIFNIRLRNATSKKIEEFNASIFICDSNLNIIYKASLNSNDLSKNVQANILEPAELDSWEYVIINRFRSSSNNFRIDISNYKKEQLRRNYKELQLIFIPNKIYFEDGTSLSQ